jgi:uncharacterized protein YutD
MLNKYKVESIKQWSYAVNSIIVFLAIFPSIFYEKGCIPEGGKVCPSWFMLNKLFLTNIFFVVLLIGVSIFLEIQLKGRGKKYKSLLQSLREERNALNNQVLNLTEENTQLKKSFDFISNDYYNQIADLLKNIFKDSNLKLGSDDRISVYRHIESTSVFFMLGRYSTYSEFRKKGRMLYPDNIGYIGKAWRCHASLHIENLPDYNTSPQVYIEKVSVETGLSKEVIEQMQMKSRYFFITKIMNTDKVTPDIILVFESMNPKRHAKRTIEKYFKEHIGHIQSYVNSLNLYEPSEEYARKHGFSDSQLTYGN